MILIGLLVIVALLGEVIHRLNPFKKPEPTYEEVMKQIEATPWYQELTQDEACRAVLLHDPRAQAFFCGTYEAKRLLQSEGFQLGLIDYVKTQAKKPPTSYEK